MITIVDCDDWKGLYVDGKLKIQGHMLEPLDVIKAITGEIPEIIEPYYEWLTYHNGTLPDDLSTIKESL